MTEILIVGAGCAGLTAAIYCARAGKQVLVLEKESVGGQIGFSPRVENYPGIASISGMAFADALYEQAMALGVRLELETVRQIVPGNPITVVSDCESRTCGAVILATGLKHRRLGLPREDELSGISYCATCDGAFYKGQDVALVGGGSTALQSAELLAGMCRRVYVIHRRADFRGEDQIARRLERLENVEMLRGCVAAELLGGDALTGVTIRDLQSGHTRTLSVQGLFVCVGQIPENAAFADAATLSEDGYIVSGEDCRTAQPGIFAAGDCRTKAVRQLTTAAADGSVAALAAIAWLDACSLK